MKSLNIVLVVLLLSIAVNCKLVHVKAPPPTPVSAPPTTV